MIGSVISAPAEATPDWLTLVLTECRALVAGQVERVVVEPVRSMNSSSAVLRLEYSADAKGEVPRTLFLKTCADASFSSSSEVDYYTRDYAGLSGAPVPRCFHAAYSESPFAYHILMEDLSVTHRGTFHAAPEPGRGPSVARALGFLHAHRWGSSKFGPLGQHVPGQSEIERYISVARAGLEPMLADLRYDIEPAWREALRELFVEHPRVMTRRTEDERGFALVHGDVNPGNILLPLDPRGQVYIVDRQPFHWSLTVWLGVSDVAYMMVHWWDIALRRQHEMTVLRSYYNALKEYGVAGYTWEQLVTDYRLAATQSVYVAVQWCASERELREMRFLWLPQLQRSMTAYFDLDCAALWR